jgi:hypothetical protein
VNVRGLDERIVDSNEASWQISFVANGQNLNDINKQITSAQDEVKKFIIQYGLSEKAISILFLLLYKEQNHLRNMIMMLKKLISLYLMQAIRIQSMILRLPLIQTKRH